MFQGSLPALITPFRNGKVDEKALVKIIEWQIAEGSNGIVPVGTTGESPSLSHEEHREVIRIVVETVNKRIPVIAGAGSNNTEEALGFVEYATEVGADAALVVTPYYNKPTQRGLMAHFEALDKASGVPIFIYNIPPRSVIDMSVETMAELAKLKNIVGVKDATADLARVCKQRIHCGKDFIQLSGEDPTAVGFNAQGGVGCISVTANVAPRLCAEQQAATLAGDYAKALEYQDRLMPLHEAIFAEPGVAGAKAGMEILGLCANEVRLPLTPVLPETYQRIEAAMRGAGVLG